MTYDHWVKILTMNGLENVSLEQSPFLRETVQKNARSKAPSIKVAISGGK
jgi:hypothetical protein